MNRRLREMEVFVAVLDAGSFAKAGTRLRLSPPAVTRAISSLEERLGVRLINRTTRSLRPTEAGQRFLESAKRLLVELDEAEQNVIGGTATPAGHLTITASVTFGRFALAPILGDFLARHPRITASLVLLDRIVNLVEEGIDVGVRISSLPDSSMVARRIGEVRRVLVASPDYLAERGAPEHPADLKLHSVIGFTGLMVKGELPFLDKGKLAQLSLKPRLEVNDAAAAIAAAEAGNGITSTLCYMVGGAMRGPPCAGTRALLAAEHTCSYCLSALAFARRQGARFRRLVGAAALKRSHPPFSETRPRMTGHFALSGRLSCSPAKAKPRQDPRTTCGPFTSLRPGRSHDSRADPEGVLA